MVTLPSPDGTVFFFFFFFQARSRVMSDSLALTLVCYSVWEMGEELLEMICRQCDLISVIIYLQHFPRRRMI